MGEGTGWDRICLATSWQELAEQCAVYAQRIMEQQARIAELERELELAAAATVTCEMCAFRYGAEHVDEDGQYRCPVCRIAELERRLETAVDDSAKIAGEFVASRAEARIAELEKAEERIARAEEYIDRLRRAVLLVLAMNDNPTKQHPDWPVRLDPKAQQQLRDALQSDDKPRCVTCDGTGLNPAGNPRRTADWSQASAECPTCEWPVWPECGVCHGTGFIGEFELCKRCEGVGRLGQEVTNEPSVEGELMRAARLLQSVFDHESVGWDELSRIAQSVNTAMTLLREGHTLRGAKESE